MLEKIEALYYLLTLNAGALPTPEIAKSAASSLKGVPSISPQVISGVSSTPEYMRYTTKC